MGVPPDKTFASV
jgi:hypothetical protein